MDEKNRFETSAIEGSGEITQEEEERRDAEIMAGLRARRAAEAEAEAAAKAEDESKINSARKAIDDSYDYTSPGSDR